MADFLMWLVVGLIIFLPIGIGLTIFRRSHRGWWAKVTAANFVLIIIFAVIGGDRLEKDKAEAGGFASVADYKEAEKLGFKTKAEHDANATTARLEAEAKAAEAKLRAVEEAAKKDAACRADLKCWAEKHLIEGSVTCSRPVERMAKYDHEWTNSFLEPKFSHYKWVDKDKGRVGYIGDKIKFQNGFGAWQHYTYQCDYDPDTKAVLNVKGEPGRLPN